MEQRRVDDRPEPAVVAPEITDVGDLEGGVGQASLGRLLLGERDRSGRLIQPDRGEPTFGQVQRDGGLPAAGVEHVAVELALLDQCAELGLRLADAPRRFEADAHLRRLALVGAVKHLIHRFSHESGISMGLICVNILDMDDLLEDQPLGYLLSRVANALRAEVTAQCWIRWDWRSRNTSACESCRSIRADPTPSLARDTNVTPQAMNMVLRGLEDRGLVTRPASVSSGRSLPAQLTRDGEDLLKRTDAGVRAAERKLMAHLTAEQRREFKRILVSLGSD